MVQIENLTKTFGKKTVLSEVSLNLENKNYALLGPNGSGKTTMFRIITGLLAKDYGTVSIDGKNIGKGIAIGYLPQNFGAFPHLTVEEMLLYLARLKSRKNDGIDWEDEVDKAVKMAHLEGQRSQKCRTLSGGMVRRLGIAQTLMGNPRLILLDEPTVGLDVEERMHMRSILDEINGRQTLVLSTHILEDAQDTCRDVVILHDTRILYQGGIEQLKKPTLEDGYLTLIKGENL